MTNRFDFAALDEHGQIALLVDVKSKRDTDVAWAQELRKLIADRAPVVTSSMFLLVTPDALYLWPARASLNEPPETLDGEAALGAYLDRAAAPRSRVIDPRVFEAVVLWWLEDLATGVAPAPMATSFAPFSRALRAGRIVTELAA